MGVYSLEDAVVAVMVSFISSPIKDCSLVDAVMVSFIFSRDQLSLVISFDLVRNGTVISYTLYF